MSLEFRMQKAERISNLFRNKLILLLALLLNVGLHAQSVDSLIAETVKNNPQLKSLNHKIKSAEFKAESVNNLPPPVLGIEFSQVPTNTIRIFDEALSQNFSISQMIPLGGKVSAMTEVEKKNISVTINSFEEYKTFLIGQLKMSYYSLWLAERKIDVQNENIKLLQDLGKSLEVLYQVNKVNQADLLTIQSEIATNETELIALNNQKDSELIKLNKLLGRNLDSKDIQTEKEIRFRKITDSEKSFEDVLKNENSSLKKMLNMVEMNKSEIVANNKELIPDLMVQGMIMRMPRGMVLTTKTPMEMIDGMGKTEIMYGLMASVTLPFAPWSVGKFSAREQELLSSIKGIEEERNDMEREMISKMKSSLLKAKSELDLISLYTTKVIPLSQQATAAQSSAYQNNLVNINTVIDSYKMLLMNQMNLFMAQADYQMALAEIEMMIGKQIFNER